MKILFASVLIGFLIILISCKDVNSIAPLDDKYGTVYGVVRDSVTQIPLENSVVVALNNNKIDTTDKNGKFTLSGLKYGSETFEVRNNDYNSTKNKVEIISDSQYIEINMPWSKGVWQVLGLENNYINRLRIFNHFLYACTNNGLWRLNFYENTQEWEYLSFPDNVSDVVVNQSNKNEILITTIVDNNTHSVFKSVDEGKNWAIADSGLEYEQGHYLNPSMFCMTSYDLFTAGYLAHTQNFGDSWSIILGIGTVFDFRSHSLYDNYLLIGSQTAFGGPLILFSSDSGKTWNYNMLESFGNSDDAILSIAFDIFNPNTIYASLSSQIIQSTNFGNDWETVFNYSGQGFIRVIVEDKRKTNRFFSGMGTKVFESRDGCTNWSELKCPSGSGITAMVYDEENRTLYVGTGSISFSPNGVFVYKTNN